MKTREITEGAIFCAIAVLLSLASYLVPFLVVLTFFIPVPMIVLGKRQGLRVSILASIAAALIIGFSLGLIIALQFGLLMLLVGCGLGLAYQKNLSAMEKSVIGTIAFAAFIILIILGFQILTGINFISSLVDSFKAGAAEVLPFYESMGLLDSSQLADMEMIIDASLKMLMMSIPTTFILLPVGLAILNISITDFILKRLGYPVKGFKKLENLKLPNHLKVVLTIFIFINFLLMVFQIDLIPEIYVYTIRNLVYLVFFVMGLACIFDYLSFKKIKSKIIKVLIVVIGLLFQSLVSFLGIVDTYFDIRKLFRKETLNK